MPDFPITANDRYFSATASAAQTVFTPDFPLLTDAELVVKRTRAGVTTTLALTTHYTISGLNQQAGFTCTLTAGAQAGDVLEFFGNTAMERQSDYPQSQALRTAALNADLDRALMRDQEVRRDVDKLDVEGDILDARDQAVAAAASATSSASAASASQTGAAGSASAASASQTAAAASASSASTSATNAGNSATSASGSAGTATTQATNAAASAGTASTQATNASASASSASTSATNATNARIAAEAARDATLAAFDSFDDRYLGPKSADPTLDNDGNPLAAGMLYFHTVSGIMKIYNGSSWVAAYVDGTGLVAKAGDTMTGPLTLPGDPANALDAAPKQYVDTRLLKSGDTMTGKLTTAASASGGAGLTLPHGAAPSAPVNGDIWSTTAAFFGRLNAATVQLSVVGHTHAQGDVTNLTADLAAKVAKAGDTMTGKLTTAASASGGAGLTLPHGAAPSAPVNGDFWSTTAAFFGRLNGVTVQLVPTSITISAGAGMTGGGDLSANRSLAIDKATDANVRAAVADKVVTADRISSASAVVALAPGANVALDWASGINFSLLPTTNFTLSNPSNVQAGTWRTVKITQHTTGGQVLTLGNQYKAAGGVSTIVLSTANSAVDFISIYAETTTSFYVFLGKDMKA